MPLTPDQARRVYDRIGRAQDWQAFYEDVTTDRLLTAAALGGEQRIFEFGCGTGRLAQRLLRTLPASVTYRGVDLSPVMINLATNRLTAWVDRADTVLVDGSLPLPADDACLDRVVSTFVFDLLDADYARAVLDNLRRIDPHPRRPVVPGQPDPWRRVPRTGRFPDLDRACGGPLRS